MAIRAAMHPVGGAVLQQLLNADGGGHRGPRTDCDQGHRAAFVDYRSKVVLTVLAPVEVRRAYYHCAPCVRGLIPKDRDLDIVRTAFSPGVRRMMGRVGGKDAFDEGRRDLEALAGVVVKTKAVERVAEAVRRGITRAEQVIVLGDGAPWIWGIADEHFPGAIQIVDLYHAREHLTDLGKLVYGATSAAAKAWAAARRPGGGAQGEGLLPDQRATDALRPLPAPGTVCRLGGRGGGLQDDRRAPAQAIRHAVVGPGGQRHHRPALRRAQWSVGGILGGSRSRLDPGTHKFDAHP